MNRKEFDRFVRRKQEEQVAAASFDDKQQLAEWYEYVDRLYGIINEYVQHYIDSGAMRIEYKIIQINEDFSGPYEMRSMLLHIGASVVVFEPIGTMLIGSKGRVDVHGPRGTARLSLINKKFEDARQMIQVRVLHPGQAALTAEPPPKLEEIEWVWKIMAPAPLMKFITLTEDTFFDMILGVADA